MEDLFHWSAEEVPWPLYRTIYPLHQDAQHDFSKPIGFWVSPDTEDGWESWCRGHDSHLERLAVKSRVVVSPTAKIMRIKNFDELNAFVDCYYGADISESFCRHGLPGAMKNTMIDWHRVYKDWDGILIIPYLFRFSLLGVTRYYWYYTWDCASGCIWNLDAIEAIERVKTEGSEQHEKLV